jgi:hypothetical protein
LHALGIARPQGAGSPRFGHCCLAALAGALITIHILRLRTGRTYTCIAAVIVVFSLLHNGRRPARLLPRFHQQQQEEGRRPPSRLPGGRRAATPLLACTCGSLTRPAALPAVATHLLLANAGRWLLAVSGRSVVQQAAALPRSSPRRRRRQWSGRKCGVAAPNAPPCKVPPPGSGTPLLAAYPSGARSGGDRRGVAAVDGARGVQRKLHLLLRLHDLGPGDSLRHHPRCLQKCLRITRPGWLLLREGP